MPDEKNLSLRSVRAEQATASKEGGADQPDSGLKDSADKKANLDTSDELPGRVPSTEERNVPLVPKSAETADKGDLGADLRGRDAPPGLAVDNELLRSMFEKLMDRMDDINSRLVRIEQRSE